MFLVGRALVVHEFAERLRDRWVLVITVLFGLLASGVALYGRTAEESAAAVTAPSIVTLATLLVPLVALVLGHDAIVGERERHTLGLLLSLPVGRSEVLVGKYLGRALALGLSIGLGLGAAVLFLGPGQRQAVLTLVPHTLLLGATFLSVGVFLSAVTRRHATAASLAVVVWFLLVFFYDLGILAALVVTDGALAGGRVGALVAANPAGLYRGSMLALLGVGGTLDDVQVGAMLPGPGVRAALWAGWIVVPLVCGGLAMGRSKAAQA